MVMEANLSVVKKVTLLMILKKQEKETPDLCLSMFR